MGGRVEGRHDAAFRISDQPGTLATRCLHHDLDVVDSLFDRRRVRNRVRQPGSALVEYDHPRELGEAAQEPGESRLGPLEVQVRGPTKGEHEVEWTLTNHLVGDAEVSSPRILRFRLHPPRLHYFDDSPGAHP